MLLPILPGLFSPAEGGKVILRQFTDGNTTREVVFSLAGSNSTVSIKIPKAAQLTRAGVDIVGRTFLENYTMVASTRDDFATCALADLDINTTSGDIQLVKVTGWDDEFCGTSLDPKWTWMNPPYASDVGSSRPGYLHTVSDLHTNFNGSADDGHLLYQIANGSYTLETKLISDPRHDHEKAGLMIRQGSGDWVALKYQAQGGKRAQWSVKTGGNYLNDINAAVNASPLYLKLVKDDKRFLSYYSTDGNSWALVWDTNSGVSVTLTDPVRVGLVVADGAAWTNYPADFDYFRLTKYSYSGSMVSPVMSTAQTVSQVRATWTGPTSPVNANTYFNVRANQSAPWQRLYLNYTAAISVPGNQAQYMVEMVSNGLRTPVLYDMTINLSSLSFVSDLTLAMGNAAPFWTQPGELNSTRTVDLKDALISYIASAAADPEGNVAIPLNFASGSPGALTLRNLTIEYLIGAPPSAPALHLPAPGSFVDTTNPVLNLSATDPDNDPVLYSLELSDDGFRTRTYYNQSPVGGGWSRGNLSYLSGQEASLRTIYPLIQGRSYSWKARAFDGAYWGPYSEERDFTVDTTPPSGAPRSAGNYTDVPTSLSAFLDYRDDVSGIDRYEYMVGTRQGAWDVVANTTAADPNVTAGGLSLVQGSRYYFTARARNGAGLWSDWASSDGILYWPAGMESAGIGIDQPANLSTVSGTVQITGMAWLRDGWKANNTVQARTDDNNWKIVAMKGSGWSRSWSMDWDSRQVLDGMHVIQARVVLGYAEGVQLAVWGISVNVSNMPAQPPPVVKVDFRPDAGGPLTTQENGAQEFTVDTNTLGLGITWMVDGEARPDETYPNFVFHTNYSSAGTHKVSVVVRYDQKTWEHNWTMTVTNVDRPPVAAIYLPQEGIEWKVGDVIDLNASTSRDPDLEDLLRFSWDLGDGTAMAGPVGNHSYSAPGTFRIVLTVSDGSLESRAIMNLTIKAASKTISGARSSELPYMMIAAAIVAIAAASTGGYAYARRRRAQQDEARTARRPDMALMVKLPAADIADEEEEAASRPRETSRHEWDRLAAQASPSALASASAVPPPEMLEETSFEDMPVEEEAPGVKAEAVEPPRYPRSTASRPAGSPGAQGPVPWPQATATSRPRVMQAPAAPAPAPRSYGPEGTTQRPQAARPAPYQPSARSTRPRSPPARYPAPDPRPPTPDTRPPSPEPRTPKNAETLEDILAILENK